MAHVKNIIYNDKSIVKDLFKEADTESVGSTDTKENITQTVPDMSYATVNELSAKLISFFVLKQKLEGDFYSKHVFMKIILRA